MQSGWSGETPAPPDEPAAVGLAGDFALLTALWLQAPLAPVLLACGLVLTLELMNTAVEALVDLVSPQPHPLAKVAKDAAAGAVLVGAFFAVLVGAAILGPPLLQRLGLL